MRCVDARRRRPAARHGAAGGRGPTARVQVSSVSTSNHVSRHRDTCKTRLSQESQRHPLGHIRIARHARVALCRIGYSLQVHAFRTARVRAARHRLATVGLSRARPFLRSVTACVRRVEVSERINSPRDRTFWTHWSQLSHPIPVVTSLTQCELDSARGVMHADDSHPVQPAVHSARRMPYRPPTRICAAVSGPTYLGPALGFLQARGAASARLIPKGSR